MTFTNPYSCPTLPKQSEVVYPKGPSSSPVEIDPVLTAALLFCTMAAGQPRDTLAEGFRDPPASARPHTWWHWMDGNVTKEGITADLEAMREVGIGGAQMFTVAQGIPKGPVDYLSPAWREMTVHAVKEAERLGIELCLHNCAGWSSSGGPWVKPEHAMQVLAWSEVRVSGPKRFEETLPPIQAPQIVRKIDYSKDIAVFAFPTPSEGHGLPSPFRKGRGPVNAVNWGEGAFASAENPSPGSFLTDLSPSERGEVTWVQDRSLFLGKTGVNRMDGLEPELGPEPAGLGIVPAQMQNLTSKFASGRLVWDVPAGNWTILRLGHVPTGKNNHPAPPEGDGLEVDKLSREAMDVFWSGTMATVIRDVGPKLAGRVLNNALIDSYEVGSQNWTPKFREEFRKRRGYDCLPWMPTLAGHTVDTKDKTERFLWDFRRTIADLFADNYFGYFKELCKRHGIQFSVEPYGNGGFDNLQVGGLADIPMGEFWLGGGTLETLKVASSAAHTNGKAIVGAESFTADDVRGRWLENPYDAKALGDLVFTLGINRYIFHRYAHQPWMDKFPGMTMGPWGTHLERTQTWWAEAAEWLKYVARCQYLLQKGKFVADVLYYTGEGAPVDLPFRQNLKPGIPAGYDYDGCDTTVLMKLRVQDGRLVLPDGMSYRVLVLPPTSFMSPDVATKIRNLVQDGAVVLGVDHSYRSPSLVEQPKADARVGEQMAGLFRPGSIPGINRIGKGMTFSLGRLDKPLDIRSNVFDALSLAPDFEYRSLSGGSKLAYIHRRIADADVYFVSNQKYQRTEALGRFRVSGRVPELWHADTAHIENAPAYSFVDNETRTEVPLRLGPAESVFVVFRKKSEGSHLEGLYLAGEAPAEQKLPKIAIKRARYESADGRGADVTAKVEELISQGEYEIAASNTNFGDPVVNVVKRLVVDYELDGKPFSKTVAENEILTLVQLPGEPLEKPAFEFGYDAAGKLNLTPWKKGRYQVLRRHLMVPLDVAEDALSLELAGPWHLNFKAGWGAPPSADLMKLISWSEHPDPGIKYFSGSATYVKDFHLPKDMAGADRAVVLDLGRVKNFATVTLNGKAYPALWKEPFAVDVSKDVKPGINRLEIKVTNLWPNRIIGDEQLSSDVEWQGVTLKSWPEWLLKGQPRPPTGRYTFTTWKFWNKDSPLLESGLLGPVVVRSAQRIEVRP